LVINLNLGERWPFRSKRRHRLWESTTLYGHGPVPAPSPDRADWESVKFCHLPGVYQRIFCFHGSPPKLCHFCISFVPPL